MLRAGAWIASALLCGCAANAYKAKLPALAATSDCSARLAAIPAIPLAAVASDPGKPRTYVEFADIAHCYDDAGQATPIALYALPDAAAPAELEVSVSLSAGGTFAAALELLDAQFRPIRRYGFDSFARRGSEYRLVAFLNAGGPRPAYAMLSPDPAQVGKSDTTVGSISTATVVPAGPVMFAMQNGHETRVTRPFLEGGRISVALHPQSAAPFEPVR